MNYPDFRSKRFLLEHVQQTMDFYYPRCLDWRGGFYHFFKNDGRIYDRTTRHLVSSARFVFNFAMAYRHFGQPGYQEAARHGLRFLREVHRQPDSGGYLWQLRWEDGCRTIIDATNHCYGLAFVLLAHAHALMAGIEEARAGLHETFALLEAHFWEPEIGLYADEADHGWQLCPYRGQNANMHACEAMLAAHEATGDVHFLDRAEQLAAAVTLRQAGLTEGLIWEHYHADWSVDWEYNKNDKTNIFRPWGVQPGHLAEWAKLLLILERQRPRPWLAERAEQLLCHTVDNAWDREYGGLYYGLAPDGGICDADKYFWVQAESLAAAALLAERTGRQKWWDWYERLWVYGWDRFVDHRHGAWYRILTRDNQPYSDEKSPAGKVDYHTMGACYEVLNVIR